ncbi:uncharacterized protein N7518_008591 [Penicillium psychrosexuale]|uniref:uncharacterized protein n=1 Tax=Penicillium psychrosexuale TaxID=1002107 RepID=UPI0025456014|nr:uncharacterized protein N7518_008591 [Penicillium psychrosexuale]KAJ5791580.1 hypothetical protein N7518_008591 [Penicillium psychrosexuale]
MSFPESKKYSQSKGAKCFTMSPNPSSDSLYLDSNVALGQRRQSEVEMEANDAAFHKAEGQEGQEGVFAGMKHQLDSMAPGGSMSEFGNSVSSAAHEKIIAAKDTLMDEAYPAAQGALRTVQGHIRAMSGGSNEAQEMVPEEPSQEERECVDKMSNEQVCDFLRERHMSNKHTQRTK